MVFFVISCRFSKVYVYRFSTSTSIWMFGPKNPVRKFFIYLTTHQCFEFFVILTILINCVCLAVKEPLEEAEYIFTAIYTFEMIIKIIGRGFILNGNTYLRDLWNWLDFCVVVLGYVTLTPNVMMNFSGIRTIRVLRALRAISAVEGLKTMVNALIRSMKMLSEVLVLTAFFICVFALVGLQLFSGQLRSRCVRDELHIPVNSTWTKEIRNSSNWYEDLAICGNNSGTITCPSNYTCLKYVGENPNYGYTSFDHFGWSLLTSFQLLTLDYWEDVYFHVLSALGSWYIIYFVFVIFFGTFLVFNLMLAVVVLSYEQVTRQSTDDTTEYKKLLNAGFVYPIGRCSLPTFIFDGPILDALNFLSEEKQTSNIFVLNTVPTKRSKQGNKKEDFSYIETEDQMKNSGKSKNSTPDFHNRRSPTISPTSDAVVMSGLVNEENSNPKETCKFRIRLEIFVTSIHFEIFIVFIILINMISLALEHHGMDENYEKRLHYINDTAVGIFVFEFILKFTALGLKKYMKSRWNIFDFVVVIVSVIEVTLVLSMHSLHTSMGLTVLRSLRLCRILKIAKSWTIMRSLLTAMAKSLNALVYLTIILGILLYMFAVIGMQLFAGSYEKAHISEAEVPYWNFVDFGHSFMVIFRVLCGEWIELSYKYMNLAGLWTPLFFIAVLIIGNFLVLNLFLASLLGSMARQSSEQELKKRTKWGKKLKWISTLNKILAFSPKEIAPENLSSTSRKIRSLSILSSNIDYMSGSQISRADGSRPNETIKKGSCSECFSKVRQFALVAKESVYFKSSIIFIIILSSVMLVLEDVHLPKRPNLQLTVQILDITFCVIFIFEALLKITAVGLIKYLKNGWNVLDLFIAIVIIIGIIPHQTGILSSLRAFRSLRALRPLRAISRWKGMKIVVNSFVRAIPSIANVALVCLMVWLIFSILGVQLFGGKFYKCLDDDGNRIDALIVPNWTICIANNLTWQNSAINFDNTLNGFLALFQIATFEGMVEIIRDAVDATEIDQQPAKMNNLYSYIYFVVFVVIGSFVLLNLFVCVMIENFYAIKKQQDDYGALTSYLSSAQKTWLLTVKRSLRKRPVRAMKRPTGFYLGQVFDVLCSAKFEAIVIVLVLVDVVVMTVQHYDQPKAIDLFLLSMNIVITILFVIELIFKIIVFGRLFFINKWNNADFFIVFISIVVIILDFFKIDLHLTPTLFRLGRLIRLGRLLRYFNKAAGLRRLFAVVINASSSAFNMTILLLIIIFIYSVIGMINFGHVKKTGAFNEIVNFETFGNSLSILLRVSTAAGWNDALDALMIDPPICQLHPVSNCPSIWGAVLYFTTYVLFSFLVIINMNIAIILENFNEVHLEGKSGITDEDIELYYAMWQLYDPIATQFIPFEKVSILIATLGQPLGIPTPNKLAIRKLEIPINDAGYVHCNTLLQALIRNFFTCRDEDTISNPEMKVIIEKKGKNAFPLLKKEVIVTTSMNSYKEERCATIIQRRVRDFLRQPILEPIQKTEISKKSRRRKRNTIK